MARGTALWESLVGKPRGKASRESHRSLDPREWKLDSAATTREEARESRPHPEEPRFRLLAREAGSFPGVFGIEFPAFPSQVKRRRCHTGKARETPGSCHIRRVPQISQSIPGKPVFPGLPRLSSRGSTHTTVARGTVLWESLVGKPRGKASRESP